MKIVAASPMRKWKKISGPTIDLHREIHDSLCKWVVKCEKSWIFFHLRMGLAQGSPQLFFIFGSDGVGSSYFVTSEVYMMPWDLRELFLWLSIFSVAPASIFLGLEVKISPRFPIDFPCFPIVFPLKSLKIWPAEREIPRFFTKNLVTFVSGGVRRSSWALECVEFHGGSISGTPGTIPRDPGVPISKKPIFPTFFELCGILGFNNPGPHCSSWWIL